MAKDPSAISATQSRTIAATVREEMARRRMSRLLLAERARISISTLEKVLNGHRLFTLATVVRLEQALSLSLRTAPSESEQAPAALGAYARDAVPWLEGSFLTLRASFECPGAIYAYRTEIAWDAALHHLVFHEEARLDPQYTHSGVVSVAFASGHIFLHTNDNGEMRLAVLSRPLACGGFYGLLTTLRADRGPVLLPVSVPFVLLPFQPAMVLGQIAPGEPAFAVYRAHLDRVNENNFAGFG